MDVFTFMVTERNRNIPTSKQKSYRVLPTLTERPVNKPLEKQSFSGNSYRNMKKKTSVSLSDSVLGRLEEASKHTRRSKSFIIEEIVECVLGQLGSSIETSDLERAIDACRDDIKRRLAEQKIKPPDPSPVMPQVVLRPARYHHSDSKHGEQMDKG